MLLTDIGTGVMEIGKPGRQRRPLPGPSSGSDGVTSLFVESQNRNKRPAGIDIESAAVIQKPSRFEDQVVGLERAMTDGTSCVTNVEAAYGLGISRGRGKTDGRTCLRDGGTRPGTQLVEDLLEQLDRGIYV